MSAYAELRPADVEVAGTGFNGPEGLAFDRAGNLYGGGQDGVIRRMTPDGTVSVLAETGGRPAGLAFDADDNLFVCVPPTGVVRITPAGDVSLLADKVEDIPLVVANFPAFDADGNLYVSNSTHQVIYGHPEVRDEELVQGRPNGSVVRWRPDGSSDVLARGLYFANGIAIDPDEQYVYVLQSSRNNCVRVPLAGGEAEPFGPDLGGLPDGMAFDADGYLIVTLPHIHRLVVLDPGGKLTTLLDDPQATAIERPTNCAFGGPDYDELYVAQLHADHVPKLRLGRRGHPLYNLR